MNLRNAIEQFPWNKFGTAYESNAKELKEKFLKILEGDATPKDYQYIIWRLEHQDSLYKLAPWGLKFYIALLLEKQTDKVILLDNIKTIFEAGNYQSQVDKVQGYKPTKGNLEKYEWLKSRLFDADFDGSLPPEFLKMLKLINRNFWHIACLEYLDKYKSVIVALTTAEDPAVCLHATQLLHSIENPKQYKFNDQLLMDNC